MRDPERIAQTFHETYERLAPEFGYKTRSASAVPWDEVPDANRALMIEVARQALNPVGIAEIAERLNVQRATVDKWRTRNLLPEPAWSISGNPAWNWPEIQTWARVTGRV